MQPRAAHTSRNNRGFVLVWVVVLMAALIGIVGLALDMGYAALVHQQLQNTADAAALAAAQQVRLDPDFARQTAVDIAALNEAGNDPVALALNEANAEDGDVVLGRFNRVTRVFTPNPDAPNAVKVVARRTDDSLGGPLALHFGPLLGTDTLGMQRDAIAMVMATAGAGLIVLHPTRRGALSVGGDVTLAVTGGMIQVNSDHGDAAVFTGTSAIECEELNVVGGAEFNGGTEWIGAINEYEPPLADPLAPLPAPSYTPSGGSGHFTIGPGTTQTINPGYYGGQLRVQGTCIMNPGIYILNNGITVAANATLLGEGVMLYIADGGLTFTSGATVTLSPPDPEVHTFDGASTYEGIAIFQARDNTDNARMEMSEYMNFSGTFYFPAARVDVHSSGDNYLSRLIASELNFSGVGRLTIDYEGVDPVAGYKPFLVE